MSTKRLNLLIIMMLGLMSPKMHAEGTEKRVMLYTPYTKISVPPGETIDYSIDVINKTDDMKNPAISVEGIPRGWTSELKSGGFAISQLAVLPDDKKSFNLKITVPLKVNKGTYHLTVKAGSDAELPISITVSSQGTFKTELTTDQPNMEGNSKSNFNFSAKLANQTAEQQLYALTANAPRGWNVIFRAMGKQATSAQVDANKTENITIEMTPPANVEAGTYKIPVRASTGSTSAELELEVVVTGSYQMEFTTPRGLLSSSITAGETKRFDLVIRNTGSAELKDIKLTASKPSDWEVNFEPSEIATLKSGETATLQAIIKASKKALPGDYMTKLDAKTPEVNSSIDFRMTVKTPMLWGWLGVLIIAAVLAVVFFLFRKYGRR